jgi:hypothetical protein
MTILNLGSLYDNFTITACEAESIVDGHLPGE